MKDNKSDQLKHNFEFCFNFLVKNNFIKAYELFLENFLKFPTYNNYLLGVIISLILSNKINEAKEFLNKELKISLQKNLIQLLINFINNNRFNIDKQRLFIFNLGLFLKQNKMLIESNLFFRICILLKPDDKKSLLLLGEYEIKKNNIEKGITLIVTSLKNRLK
jgi:hypothetical protein